MILKSILPKHIIAIIPVSATLDLKKLAKHLKIKNVSMMDANKAEKITGYLLGAISPIAQKKQGYSLIDVSALLYEQIYISGGRRGLEISINPRELSKVINSEFIPLT